MPRAEGYLRFILGHVCTFAAEQPLATSLDYKESGPQDLLVPALPLVGGASFCVHSVG